MPEFNFPLVKALQDNCPAVPCYNLDAGSDALLWQYAQQALGQEKVGVVVDLLVSGQDADRLVPFLRKLSGSKGTVKVLLLGSHPLIEKILGLPGKVQAQKVDAVDAALKELMAFFRA